MIKFLSQSEDRNTQAVGGTLATLYNRRLKADYKIDMPMGIHEAEDSVEMAEELIEGTLEEMKVLKKGGAAS